MTAIVSTKFNVGDLVQVSRGVGIVTKVVPADPGQGLDENYYYVEGKDFSRDPSGDDQEQWAESEVNFHGPFAASLLTIDELVAGAGPLIDAVVAEHNRIRKDPASYAAELEKDGPAIVAARINNDPTEKDSAPLALKTAIADLKSITGSLPPLTRSDAGCKSATIAARDYKFDGIHTADVNKGWTDNGSTGCYASAESITSRGTGSDEEKAKEIVRGLLLDFGNANQNNYQHREFIVDYAHEQPLTTGRVDLSKYKKSFKFIGVGIVDRQPNGIPVFIQYAF